jgi:hypothetical protein
VRVRLPHHHPLNAKHRRSNLSLPQKRRKTFPSRITDHPLLGLKHPLRGQVHLNTTTSHTFARYISQPRYVAH